MPTTQQPTTATEGESSLRIADIKLREFADGQSVSIDPHISILEGQFTAQELRKIADAMEELSSLGAPSITAEVRSDSEHDEFKKFWDAGKAQGAKLMIVTNIDQFGVCHVPYYVMADDRIFCGEECSELVTDRSVSQFSGDHEFNFEENFDLQFAKSHRPLHGDSTFGHDLLD